MSTRQARSRPTSRPCGQAMDAAGHPALLAVDCIASLGCDEFRMDDWGVDVMVAACQKGLMTPAGHGLRLVLGSRPPALRQDGPCHALLGLGTPRRTRGVLADLGRHRPDQPPLRAARSFGHDPRGRSAECLEARHHTLASAVWAAFDCVVRGQPRHRDERGGPRSSRLVRDGGALRWPRTRPACATGARRRRE